jgi:hypothetical protein
MFLSIRPGNLGCSKFEITKTTDKTKVIVNPYSKSMTDETETEKTLHFISFKGKQTYWSVWS